MIRWGCSVGEVIRRTKGGKFLGYYLRWYEAGKRRQLASKQPTYAEARRMLIAIEARVARGEASLPLPVAPSPTFEVLVERFLSEYERPRVKDMAKYRKGARVVLGRALPQLGKLRADSIRSLDIASARDAMRKLYAPGSIKLTLAYVSTVLAWAKRQGLVAANPGLGVEQPRAGRSIEFWTQEEVQQLLAGARAGAADVGGKLLYACIAFALHTGLRKGELCGLRWQDLDLESRRLTVARSYGTTPKSGKARHLRLPAALVPLLREWRACCPRSKDGRVFPIVRRINKGLPEVMRAVGLPATLHPWHKLRHTYSSHYIMQGGNILALQKILGHADVKMTLVYAHLAPDYLGDEMDRLKWIA